MDAPYTCPYHRYQGDDPCDECEVDPARTDDDAQRALTTTDDEGDLLAAVLAIDHLFSLLDRNEAS